MQNILRANQMLEEMSTQERHAILAGLAERRKVDAKALISLYEEKHDIEAAMIGAMEKTKLRMMEELQSVEKGEEMEITKPDKINGFRAILSARAIQDLKRRLGLDKDDKKHSKERDTKKCISVEEEER